jgi:type III secretion apparatus needle protein
MGLDISSVNQTLGQGLQRVGSDLRSKISAAQGQDLSEEQMLDLQFDVNAWSMMVNLQSNIMKTMADTMKNTVSNLR